MCVSLNSSKYRLFRFIVSVGTVPVLRKLPTLEPHISTRMLSLLLTKGMSRLTSLPHQFERLKEFHTGLYRYTICRAPFSRVRYESASSWTLSTDLNHNGTSTFLGTLGNAGSSYRRLSCLKCGLFVIVLDASTPSRHPSKQSLSTSRISLANYISQIRHGQQHLHNRHLINHQRGPHELTVCCETAETARVREDSAREKVCRLTFSR